MGCLGFVGSLRPHVGTVRSLGAPKATAGRESFALRFSFAGFVGWFMLFAGLWDFYSLSGSLGFGFTVGGKSAGTTFSFRML